MRYVQVDVAICKGGNSKAEMNRAHTLQQQEMALMQQQLQNQMNQIGQVNAVVDPIIKNGGMTPEEETAMKSITMNTLPQTFNNAVGQINNQLVQRGITGGGMAGSGDIARNFGSLAAMEGQLQQQGLSDIQIQKANLLRQALGAKMGVAGMFGQNTGMFNQGSTNALNAGVNAANNADQAQSSFMGSLFGALTYPFSITTKPICWIARAVYGESDPRWLQFRNVMLRNAETSHLWRVVLGAYIAIGEPLSWMVGRSRVLKFVFRKVFDGVLANA